MPCCRLTVSQSLRQTTSVVTARVRFPVENVEMSVRHHVRDCPTGTVDLDQSHAFRVDVLNAWRFTPTHFIRLHGLDLGQRGGFTSP